MAPYLYGFQTYFLMWLLAAATAIGVGSLIAWREEFPVGRSVIALSILTGAIVLGSKLEYLIEVRLFPFDDYVPITARGLLHGFRIPGGIAVLAVAIPISSRILGLPWRRFGDAIIPLAAVAVVIVRVGCLLNGCCFGRVTDLPWAIQFPPGSWTFWYHLQRGWIASSARASLPVHPLQLYFIAAAVTTFVTLISAQRRRRALGSVQMQFYFMFFSTTALLEPLRESALTANNLLTPIGAAAALVGWFITIRGPSDTSDRSRVSTVHAERPGVISR